MPNQSPGERVGAGSTVRSCPTCGAQTPRGGEFCEQCGATLPEGGATATRRGLRVLLLAGWALLVVLLLVWLIGQLLVLK